MSPSACPEQRVAVVIPAKDEATRIATTVRACRAIPRVDLVVVVDDGSVDDTQDHARAAGAVVVRHSVTRGKASALETGASVVGMRDFQDGPARLLLFIDADLGGSAATCAQLVPPVLDGAADFSIAVLPKQAGACGRGRVVRAARRAVAAATGWLPVAPLSGQRCLPRSAYEAAVPLADGWGVEVAMTIDLGILAGYFRGWVDDAIQYLYTTLSSIPGVLLIAAAMLMMQVLIDTHAQWFGTAAERADLRLLALCFILGLTSWTSLARLLRGETLKLRELEYIQAAQAFGVADLTILRRHVLPNLMHLVIIALVMDFSGLVLAEAVLSYVGIGVDPTMISFGTMINNARMELSREPAVWWSLAAAFVFMFALVLAANLLADAVRDAFDPRIS